jgi:N-acylneuraminate cytidylyltransferase
MVAGKPLIAWTIEEAEKSTYIDRLVLSSEDSEIIRVAKEWGCEVPFVRPAELAKDDTPGVEPVIHALEVLPVCDYVVLLQPTSPLRKCSDIDACIELCVNEHASSCVSISEPDKSPYWMFKLAGGKRLKPLMKAGELPRRRQELPKVYAVNGAVYVTDRAWLLRSRRFIGDDTVGYEMPRERGLDIDTEFDLRICEVLLTKMGKR